MSHHTVEEKINTWNNLFLDIFLVFQNDSVVYLLLMLENKSTKPRIAAQKSVVLDVGISQVSKKKYMTLT